jgi:lactose/L-arabinose transport system permease protein
VFIAPALILFGVFMVYPIIYSFILSLQTQLDGNTVWVGIDNYSQLLGDDKFKQALLNTCWLLAGQVPLMLGLGMLLAVTLNSKWLHGKELFRTIYFLPSITALAAVSVIFRTLFKESDGFINYMLGLAGFDPIPWSTNGFWNIILLMLAVTWRWTGFNRVIYLSGLQSIPNDLYEAAAVDGATPVGQFFRITLPLMRPIIIFTSIFSTIGTLQLFDESYLLTRGGSDDATLTVGLYLYRTAFQGADFNYASTVAYGLVVIIAILSVIQFKFARVEEI